MNHANRPDTDRIGLPDRLGLPDRPDFPSRSDSDRPDPDDSHVFTDCEIVSRQCGVTNEVARVLLEEAGNDVPRAILTHMCPDTLEKHDREQERLNRDEITEKSPDILAVEKLREIVDAKNKCKLSSHAAGNTVVEDTAAGTVVEDTAVS